MNTTDFLSIASAICPDRDFMVFEGSRRSYFETSERVNKLADALSEIGVAKGDRIGVLSVNCPQYIEIYFAAAKVGAIFVPLNFRAKADELAYMVEASRVKTLFIGERYLPMVKEQFPEIKDLQKCVSIDVPYEGMLTYEDLIESGSEEEIFIEIDDDDVTILMFTSGTTGRPKAVPQTHNTFSTYILENVDPADPEIEEKNILRFYD